jgi:tetratricopeptide (TPR) repeat protein
VRAGVAAIAMGSVALLVGGCQTGGGGAGSAMERSERDSRRAQDFAAEADRVLANSASDPEAQREALRLLEAAIERNPTLTVAHVQMGQIFRQQGDFTEAERAFGRAASLEPRNFDAQFGHADALHALGRLVEAVRSYLRALAIRPNDVEANRGVAAAYLELREPRQALPYAERSVDLAPDDGGARANLGAIFSSLERHEQAVRQYEAAAELMDLTPELLLNWANSLGVIGRYREMLSTLERSIAIEPTAAAWERSGFARFKLREFAAAGEAFRRALELDPNHYPAMNGLAVVLLNEYLQTGREQDAIRIEALGLLRRSLRLNANQPKFVDLVQRFERG